MSPITAPDNQSLIFANGKFWPKVGIHCNMKDCLLYRSDLISEDQ
jgi:hypothetical protein